MRGQAATQRRSFRLIESIEMDAPVDRVFARWTHYEELPRLLGSVRRVKCIDASQILWDVDIAGRQLVWEARVVECVPQKLVRWESHWGASHRGELRFEALPGGRSRLEVEIELHPRGLLEYLGAWLGLVDRQVRRDLGRFRHRVELSQDRDSG
jgi:uncharacterized membrane protein